ncbi:acylphosphatase [Patescibacteria group bacterium]|nr:acylphosphatase [Patescibacteria group bacterium]
MIKAYRLIISGDVQGVFYRHNAKKAADQLKITGWIKNKQDGTVVALIQGEEETTKKFIIWSNEGSPMSTVEDVEVESIEPDQNLTGFEIK